MAKTYDLTEECITCTDDELTIENELFSIDLFVQYPVEHLDKLATKIRKLKLSRDDIIRIIEFVKMDTYITHRALALGVHPITGQTWYRTDPDAVLRVEWIVKKNNKIVLKLKELLRAGENSK